MSTTSAAPAEAMPRLIAARRSSIASCGTGIAAVISAMIAAGSSPRGLSLVTRIASAWREATAPISGRLPRSRSPPQPMHAAGDRLQARERRSSPIEGHAGHEHRRQHAQKIGYVEAPEERAFDPRLAPGAAHLEG